jgi:hypothetical protein
MSAENQRTYLQEKKGVNRLVTRGIAVAALALAGNLLVYFLAPALFNINLEIPVRGPGSPIGPLPVFMVVVATIVPTILATILMAVLNRFAERPLSIFRITAVILLLLSFAGPFSLPVSLSVQVTLVLMHIITAAAVIFMLSVYQT